MVGFLGEGSFCFPLNLGKFNVAFVELGSLMVLLLQTERICFPFHTYVA